MLNTGTQKHTLEAHEQRDDLEQELARVSLRMRGQQLPVDDREEEVAVEHAKLALRHVRRLIRSAIWRDTAAVSWSDASCEKMSSSVDSRHQRSQPLDRIVRDDFPAMQNHDVRRDALDRLELVRAEEHHLAA